MKNRISFFFTCIAALCIGCKAQEPEADDVVVSEKCAAVLLAASSTLGAGMAYALTPVALCTAGFCAPGVAGSSFAAWWQSTMPLVVKGGLFAQFQATAMGGVGVSTTVAGAALGGTVGARYLRDFCSFVDETDPESAGGLLFDASLTAVTSTIKAKHEVQAQCASSAICTAASEAGVAAVESISSMWDTFTTQVSKAASRGSLRWEIIKFEADIEKQKREFGVHVFDYMRKLKTTWTWNDTELESIYNDSLEKVQTLETQIKEKQQSSTAQVSTESLDRMINRQKGEFGVRVFDYMYYNKKKFDVTGMLTELENTYNETFERVSALDSLIQEKEAKVAELV